MNALTKRTIQTGLTVGLSLGAIVGLVGCSEEATGEGTDSLAGTASENGLSMNGLSMNGLSMNGLSMNGLSMNGLSMNGLSMNGLSMNGLSMNGLSSTSGLMTTNGGRDITKYMVKCALPAGHTYVGQDQNSNSYSFPGMLGVAPEWETSSCGKDCQERMSACLLAHVNNAGAHIALWLDGEGAVGWGKSTDYPYMEGAFFGNMITNQNSNNVAGGWTGYYCNGNDYDQGSVPGRLGAALTSTVYQNWYGGGVLCTNGQGGNNKCNMHGDGSGFDNCTIAPNGVPVTYSHVVTVWRNFEQGMPYKVCGYSNNLCLAASASTGGTAVNAVTYTGSTMQQWYVTQVSAGKYKLVNVATGLVLDTSSTASGTGAVQNVYTGSANQLISVKTIVGNPGKFFLVPNASANSNAYDGGWSPGSRATITNNTSANSAWWVLTGIVGATAGASGVSFDPNTNYRIRPMSATNSSLDVYGGQTNNGTPFQEFTTYDGDVAQNFRLLASGSNWKIALTLNQAKCVGPVNNGTGNSTQMEIQDCNGSSNQAWTVTSDGTTGSVIFKNVAAGRCLDVPNGSTADFTRMQIYDCWNTNGQKFAVN